MSDKIKITGLELKTKDGKKVELTLEEAKELHEQLDELFGKEVKYVPSTPIYVRSWWETNPYPYYGVTCTSNNLMVTSNNTGMSVNYSTA